MGDGKLVEVVFGQVVEASDGWRPTCRLLLHQGVVPVHPLLWRPASEHRWNGRCFCSEPVSMRILAVGRWYCCRRRRAVALLAARRQSSAAGSRPWWRCAAARRVDPPTPPCAASAQNKPIPRLAEPPRRCLRRPEATRQVPLRGRSRHAGPRGGRLAARGRTR